MDAAWYDPRGPVWNVGTIMDTILKPDTALNLDSVWMFETA